MSGQRPLTHVIYTNAPGREATTAGLGFRTLTVPPDVLDRWPARDRRRIESFLVGLTPACRVEALGMAAHCLRLGGALSAILVRFVPGFERDAHGRPGGLLLHAALIPIEEWTDRCLHHQALLTTCTAVTEDVAEADLDSYLESCRRHESVECLSLDVAVLTATLQRSRTALATFLTAVQSRGEPKEITLPLTEDEMPAFLIAAGSALPPRLRLALRWTVGLEGGGEGFLRVRSDDEVAAPPVMPAVERYLRRLEALLGAGRVRIVEGWLHDWEIRSWSELTQRVEEVD